MSMDEEPLPAAITVSAMARTVGLSRSRFHQLIRSGFFELPSRHPVSGRPYYDPEQQRRCTEARRSCLGINGQIVIFYDRPVRSNPGNGKAASDSAGSHRVNQRGGKKQASDDPIIIELKHGLAQLGMKDADDEAIKQALDDAFPGGHHNVGPSQLLMVVFRSLRGER